MFYRLIGRRNLERCELSTPLYHLSKSFRNSPTIATILLLFLLQPFDTSFPVTCMFLLLICLSSFCRKVLTERNMFVVLVTTVVLLCSQLGNADVLLRREIDLQSHSMGSQGTYHTANADTITMLILGQLIMYIFLFLMM